MLIHKSTRVLVIEDNTVFRDIIQMLLKDIGLEHIWASASFENGLDTYESVSPDVLILDVDLGKNQKNGIDFANKIRENDKNIPIIYVTSYYDDAIYLKCRSTRPSAFLSKELSRFKLEQAIDLALQYPISVLNSEESSATIPALTKQSNFFFKVGDIFKSIPVDEIVYFFAENKLNYAKSGQRNFPTSVQLKTLEKEFFPTFLRIHKSYLVNVSFIASINPGENTISINNETLPIGYAYKKIFMDNLLLLK